MRLSRLLPQSRLVLSGGDYQGISPDALIMQQVALDQGVARDKIILETASLDTTDQAKFLRDRLGQAPFYLVTSASHMTRAMRMFIRSGTQPIAAPTDFRAVWAPFQVTDFFTQAGILANTERAFYEYLGLFWGLIRGQIEKRHVGHSFPKPAIAWFGGGGFESFEFCHFPFLTYCITIVILTQAL